MTNENDLPDFEVGEPMPPGPAPGTGGKGATANGKDRRPRSARPAVVPIDGDGTRWRTHLICTDKGKPLRMTVNCTAMLTRAPEWQGVLGFDAFAERIVTLKPPPWRDEQGRAPGPWTEQDDVRLVQHVERELGFSLKAQDVRASVDNVARRASVNPLTDWLDGLVWDREQRIDRWTATYLGADATPYAADVGRWFMIGAVARAYRPGCKVDHVLVLEGTQGKRKSTALRVLAGDAYFADTPIDLGSKDRFVTIQGTWIHEVAELDGFDRGEVNRIKSYVTSAVDVYRPPYGRGAVRLPRRCVFAATVNGDSYLRDETGNRRFWPLSCGTIDVVALERDRLQLWAEAVFRFKAGNVWWPDTEEGAAACADEQSGRVSRDAWGEKVADYLAGQRSMALPVQAMTEVTVAELLAGALKLDVARWTQPDQNRVARCLRLLGWSRASVRRDGRKLWIYRAPAATSVSTATSPPAPTGGA